MNQQLPRTLSGYGSIFTFEEPSKASAVTALVAKTFIVGFSYVILKQGTMVASATELLVDRIILAFVILFMLKSLGLFRLEPIGSKLKVRLALLSLLYPIGFFLFQIIGIQLITASESAIIYALIPVFTLILSALIIKEQSTGIQKTGVVISIAGILYIKSQSVSQFSSSPFGYSLTFLSLLTLVFYFITLKKISRNTSTLSLTYYLLKYATVFIVPVFLMHSLLRSDSAGLFERFNTELYIWIVFYLSILSTLVTLYLTNYGIKKLSTSQVAVFSNLSPVIGVLSGVIILNDPWEFYHIIGGILVFMGIYMSLKFTSPR